jgi:hypothetical protein
MVIHALLGKLAMSVGGEVSGEKRKEKGEKHNGLKLNKFDPKANRVFACVGFQFKSKRSSGCPFSLRSTRSRPSGASWDQEGGA